MGSSIGSNTADFNNFGRFASLGGSVGGAIVGISSIIEGSLAGGLSALGSAGPVLAVAGPVGAAVAAAAMLAAMIFKGADPTQRITAWIEQAYIVAADNIYALAQNGMISPAEAAATISKLIPVAQAAIQSSQGSAQAKGRGIPHVQGVLLNEQSAASALTTTVTVPLDATTARAFYPFKEGAAGWEKGSITEGNTLADQLIVYLSQNRTAQGPTALPDAGSSVAPSGSPSKTPATPGAALVVIGGLILKGLHFI
jgi:hypothetical protein